MKTWARGAKGWGGSSNPTPEKSQALDTKEDLQAPPLLCIVCWPALSAVSAAPAASAVCYSPASAPTCPSEKGAVRVQKT